MKMPRPPRPPRADSAARTAPGRRRGLGGRARRRAGVAGQLAEHYRRTARVAAMTGIERGGPAPVLPSRGREFHPILDLVPAIVGAVGLIFVSAVVWLSLKLSLGIDLIAEGRKLLGDP